MIMTAPEVRWKQAREKSVAQLRKGPCPITIWGDAWLHQRKRETHVLLRIHPVSAFLFLYFTSNNHTADKNALHFSVHEHQLYILSCERLHHESFHSMLVTIDIFLTDKCDAIFCQMEGKSRLFQHYFRRIYNCSSGWVLSKFLLQVTGKIRSPVFSLHHPTPPPPPTSLAVALFELSQSWEVTLSRTVVFPF